MARHNDLAIPDDVLHDFLFIHNHRDDFAACKPYSHEIGALLPIERLNRIIEFGLIVAQPVLGQSYPVVTVTEIGDMVAADYEAGRGGL